MFTPAPSVAKVGPDAVATTLCASNTEALVPKAGPCRQEPKRPLSLLAHLLCAIPAVMASAKGHLLRRHSPPLAPAQTQASWKEVA